MFNRIVIGNGNRRTEIALAAGKDARVALGDALKGALFPTPDAANAAMKRGIKRKLKAGLVKRVDGSTVQYWRYANNFQAAAA